MGQSRLERLYAFVETKEGDLASNGSQWSRESLGFQSSAAGIKSARRKWKKLQQLEKPSPTEKIGGGRQHRRLTHPRFSVHFVISVPTKKPQDLEACSFAFVFVNTQTPHANSTQSEQVAFKSKHATW